MPNLVKASLQKNITWLKKSRKGKEEWIKPSITIGFNKPKNLNTLIKTR
jgi:hypothetical protein